MSKQVVAATLAAVAIAAFGPRLVAQRGPADFQPTYMFDGSAIDGWARRGAAVWSAAGGVITGRATSGGGLLLLDRSLQDVAFFARFRCQAACDAGVLFQVEPAAGGLKGILLSLKPGDVAPYRVTIDANGRIVTREFAGTGPAPGSQPAPPPPAPSTFPVLAAATKVLTAPVAIRPGAWNSITVFIDRNEILGYLDKARNVVPTGHVVPAEPLAAAGGVVPPITNRYGYGPVGLYVGSGTVEFDELSLRDLMIRTFDVERTSPRFRVERFDDFYYAWGADAADVNGDGTLDLVSGPFYYLGPDFRVRREFYERRVFNPGLEYVNDMLTFANDWTGDGRVDVLATERRPIVLYVNANDESRRWDRHEVLPDVCSEIAVRADLFADRRPAIVYVGRDGRVAFGRPDPARPTEPWPVNKISDPIVEGCNTHGIGTGDINGDGRLDIVSARGWWEQPVKDAETGPWLHRDAWFGEITRRQHPGGAEIVVSDFNGDGLNDVVTSLSAHAWGLAWFEQKRDASGAISFVEHTIMGDFSTRNTGDVTFSQLHSGATLMDVNRDGVMDFITGKRHWAHLDSYGDPDPHGEAVIYWYETVRDANAPGGARFIPHLIHNRSGVGSEVKVIDVDKDGLLDLVTAGTRGLFVFWGVDR